MPVTISGLQTPRWPQRACSHLCALGGFRGLQGLLHLKVQLGSTCSLRRELQVQSATAASASASPMHSARGWR